MAVNLLPDNITVEEFQAALDRYDETIEATSASKSSESGVHANATDGKRLMPQQLSPVKRR